MASAIINRILARTGISNLTDLLSRTLTASELSSLLLEVFRLRTRSMRPPDVLRQYEHNRFVAPSGLDVTRFLARDLSLLSCAQQHGYTPLELSPVCPLGTCSVPGPADQNKIMSALRGTEVVADATNVLALECSRRRKLPHQQVDVIRLCASHRHLRTPPVTVPGHTQHFRIFCMATAGRDTGSYTFEREVVCEHIGMYTHFLRQECGIDSHRMAVIIRMPDNADASPALFDAMRQALASQFPDLAVTQAETAHSEDNYYSGFNFKLRVSFGDNTYEIGDGGLTDWTQQFLGNAKERFFISGIGTEMLFRLLSDTV